MTRVEEMAGLVEGIARSFDNRMSGLEALKQGVAEEMQAARDHLREVSAARRETSTRLRSQMAMDRQALESQVGEMIDALSHGRVEMAANQHRSMAALAAKRRADVADGMARARSARRDMGARQGKSLAAAHRQRAEEALMIRKDAQEFLARTHDDRISATAAMREALAADRAGQQAAVRDLLAGMRSDLAAMSQDQAIGMASHRAALRAEVSESIAAFQASRAAIRANLEEFGQRWTEFAMLMRGKRAGPSSAGVEEPARGGERPPSDGREAGSDYRAETALFSTPSAASREDASRLGEEVFLLVQDSMEGIKLADLENRFAVSRIEMAQILKRLMEEGRVRKEDKLYFVT